MTKIYVLGKGGHANSVIEVIKSLGSDKIIQLPYDDVFGESLPEIGGAESGHDLHHAIAIGDVRLRELLASSVFCQQTVAHSLLSSNASIAEGAKIGRGSVVMPSATVRAGTAIGDYCIINTGSIIEHDCNIGSFVNISPGAVLCGNVSVDRSCLVGAGSVIIDNVRICSGVVIGAGAVVLNDINEPGTYVGVPARRI